MNTTDTVQKDIQDKALRKAQLKAQIEALKAQAKELDRPERKPTAVIRSFQDKNGNVHPTLALMWSEGSPTAFNSLTVGRSKAKLIVALIDDIRAFAEATDDAHDVAESK